MQITLESLDAVMNATGASYEEAKDALLKTDGDVEAAVEVVRARKAAEETVNQVFEEDAKEETEDQGEKVWKEVSDRTDEAVERIKALVKDGNVDRIVISRNGETILSIPVNVGLVGGIVGLVAAPWAMITAAVAAYGFSCKIEVIKKDGTNEEV